MKEAGTYEVTYKVTDSKGASAIKTITVIVKKGSSLAQSITINNKINSLYVGSNKVFTAIVNAEADIQEVEWSVNNESIASIEVTGNSVKVTAKAKGQVTITAKTKDGSNKIDTFTINIEEYENNVVDFVTNIIDTNVVSAITGSGEKESPLQMEVQNISLEKFTGFLNSIKELDALLEEKRIDGDFIVYKIKVKNTSLVSRVVRTIKNESNDEAYIELRISKELDNVSVFESKLEEVISKIDDENKPGDESKPGDENKPGDDNRPNNKENLNNQIKMEDSKKDKLPETGKRSLLGYIGAFTIAAGSLLLGKNKKK